MDDNVIFTIGYSGFGNEVSSFIHSLRHFEINALIDVRSTPYSSFYTAYNREALGATLSQAGIVYRNYSREFGARQEDKSLYPNGYLDFELFSKTPQFQDGVNKVVNGISKGYRIALMCSEKDPISCHRTILVAKAFSDLGYTINHILPGNNVKTQEDIEEALLSLYPRTLFDDDTIDDLDLAYQKQNAKIGFKAVDLQ